MINACCFEVREGVLCQCDKPKSKEEATPAVPTLIILLLGGNVDTYYYFLIQDNLQSS